MSNAVSSMAGNALTAQRAGGLRLAIVLWSGDVGGAEVVSLSLADRMRRLGVDVTLVFLQQSQPLASRLENMAVPYRSLDFGRGRDVLQHPRRYASEIAAAGPDGALLVECGFMGAALRAGGYRGPIVAVEHGAILEARGYPLRRRLPWRVARMSGAWADDIEVAVSDFILERLCAYPHASSLRRIYNGIDPSQYTPLSSPSVTSGNGDCTVIFGGRLIHGKGPDYLIEAIGLLRSKCSLKLLIAGDGPERARLESLARSVGAGDLIEFLGLRHDMPALWQMADVAVVPSAEFIEACPMTPLEAMAAGKPIVATRNGGLPEIVVDGETGLLVAPGDAAALAKALTAYADDPALRLAHGTAGQARVNEHFTITSCAQAYLDLFTELAHR
jgi:glycosyltransferase involved in cell wall biosynthesis